MPQPAKLKAPVGTPAQEAAVVWHELLAARHLLHATASVGSADVDRRPFPHPLSMEASGVSPPVTAIRPTAAHVSAPASIAPWLGGGLSGAFVVVALSVGGFIVRRRRRTAAETSS